MMHKKIKLISKGIFLLVVVFLTVKVYNMVFHEEIKIVHKDVEIFEVSQEKIISSGKEIVIKSFEEIQSAYWVDDDVLVIEGRVENQEKAFQFDVHAKALTLYKPKLSGTIEDSSYNYIMQIPNKGELCTLGNKIGLLSEDVFKVIAEDATYNGHINFKVSEDLSKIIYYHHDKDTLVTYNFEKDFYRTINVKMDDTIRNDFESLVQISPMAGYVSVEKRFEAITDSNFSIYGADSGRLYAEDVYGTHLSWSSDDRYVCFYYSKESQLLETALINDQSIQSNRIGYYDVEKKDIKYLDSSMTEQSMLSQIYWNGETVTTLTGQVGQTITFYSILSYDFATGIFNEWQLDLDPIESDAKVDLINYPEEFVLSIQTSSGHHLYKILKNSKEVLQFENLIAFDLLDQEDVYFFQNNGTFITMNTEHMTVSSAGSEGYITVDDSAFKVLPNPSLSQVAVWLTQKSEIRILSTK